MRKYLSIVHLINCELQVSAMDELFQQHRESPPLHKNHPAIGGAIFWERSLFHRIKHTIVRFLTMEDMMQSEMGKHVSVGSSTHTDIEQQWPQ